MPKGRKDGRISKANDTVQLPAPTSNISELQQNFSQRGLSMKDLVALSGTYYSFRNEPLFSADLSFYLNTFFRNKFCRRPYTWIRSLLIFSKQNPQFQCHTRHRSNNEPILRSQFEKCLSDAQKGEKSWSYV